MQAHEVFLVHLTENAALALKYISRVDPIFIYTAAADDQELFLVT